MNQEEAHAAAMQLFPYCGIRNSKIAFDAADGDGGGVIDKQEFASLFRCLMYLNKHRHAIDDILEQVNNDEFCINDDGFCIKNDGFCIKHDFFEQCNDTDTHNRGDNWDPGIHEDDFYLACTGE